MFEFCFEKTHEPLQMWLILFILDEVSSTEKGDMRMSSFGKTFFKQ